MIQLEEQIHSLFYTDTAVAINRPYLFFLITLITLIRVLSEAMC